MATSKAPAENQETDSLADFKFDDQEFFGIKPSGNQTDETLKEVKGNKINDEDDDSGEVTDLEDKKKEKKTEKGKSKKEEDDNEPEEVTFFEDETEKKPKKKAEKVEEEEEEEEGKKEEEEEEEISEEEKDKEFYTTLATELKEKGIFENVEIPKDKKLTEEEFFELQDKEVEARVTETFENFFEEMDADGKAFLKHKKNGGSTAEFFNRYGSDLDIDKLDETDAEQVQKVLIHHLTTVEKLDADELKDRLEFIKENGKEKTYAVKWFNASEKRKKEEREALETEVAERAEQKEKESKAFNDGLVKFINGIDTIGVFTLTKAEQKEIASLLTKPTVKVGKNKYVPQLSADLAQTLSGKTEEDKKRLIILAKLYKDKFDLSGLETKKTTEVAKKAKSKLQEAKEGVKVRSSGGGGKKGLAEFFME